MNKSLPAIFACFFLCSLFAASRDHILYPQTFAGTQGIFVSEADSASDRMIIRIPDVSLISPRIALVLSGGGARGISQIGVLKAFEDEDIKINFIAGTSIGSLVGGLYSVGYSAASLDSIARNTDWEIMMLEYSEHDRQNEFLDQKKVSDRSLVTLRFDNFEFVIPQAISFGTKFNRYIKELYWNSIYNSTVDFDRLKYKFRAVATDIVSGRTVALKSGNFVDAIRASSAVPIRYTPVRIDSMVLMDGGLMANIPIDAVKDFNPDITVTVNSTSPLLESKELDNPLNLADQVVSVMMKKFSDKSLSNAGFVITPGIGSHKFTDFSKTAELIDKGYSAAMEVIPGIKNSVRLKQALINDSLAILLGSNIKFYKLQAVNFEPFDSIIVCNSNSVAGLVSILSELKGYSDYIAELHNDTIIRISATKYFIPNHVQFIKSIDIEGFDEFVLNINKAVNGKYLNPNVIRMIIEATAAFMRPRGFSYGAVAKIRFDEVKSLLTVEIDAGLITNIEISGISPQGKFLVSRELGFGEAEPVSTNELITGWENLINTDYFSDAEIVVAGSAPDSGVTVKVKVDSKGNQKISIGLRVDNERNAQFGIDLMQINLFNLGSNIAFRIAGGAFNQFYQLSLENPRIRNTLFGISLKTYFDEKSVFTYKSIDGLPRGEYQRKRSGRNVEERYGFNGSVGSQIGRNGSFTAMYRLESQRYFDSEATEKPDYYTLSSLLIKMLFDSEDIAYFPTKGQFFDMFLETNLSKGQQFVGYSKAYFHARANFSSGIFNVRPSFLIGVADATLPQPEFFSLGGEDSFFGLMEDEERGRQIIKTSVEARFKSPYPIFFDTYLLLRYDLGAVWEKPEEIKFSSLKHGIGISLALDTPLGPAKFSVGKSFYLVKKPDGIVQGPVNAYFSIGMKLF